MKLFRWRAVETAEHGQYVFTASTDQAVSDLVQQLLAHMNEREHV